MRIVSLRIAVDVGLEHIAAIVLIVWECLLFDYARAEWVTSIRRIKS